MVYINITYQYSKNINIKHQYIGIMYYDSLHYTPIYQHLEYTHIYITISLRIYKQKQKKNGNNAMTDQGYYI